MGVTLRYIQTENGHFLYEQKRHLTGPVWQRQIIRALDKAGFSVDEIVEIMRRVSNREYYFNRAFYRPVREVVQEQVELTF